MNQRSMIRRLGWPGFAVTLAFLIGQPSAVRADVKQLHELKIG